METTILCKVMFPKGPCTQYLGTVFGFWVIGIIVQVWGKYMIIRYLDPEGNA